MENSPNYLDRLARFVINIMDTPVTYVRENLVVPNQKKYPWYHQKYRRVPTIDECDVSDYVCYFEANQQYKRDKLVDSQIVQILRGRYEECMFKNEYNRELCSNLYDTYRQATAAWYCKHGEMGINSNVLMAFMKQKHRMIWERRHGPVGSGINPKYPPLLE